MAGYEPVSAWNDPLAQRVKREFEKLCINQCSEVTEILATKFLKESVDNGLIVIRTNRNNDGQEALISDPGRFPDEIGRFYH